MPKLPVVLIHGYSDSAHSFEQWREALVARGYEATTIHLGEYVTLSNDINIKDIAEGLDRALRIRAGLSKDDPFDALVHSTGMLVVREWLTGFAARKDRLKHLIGLAPATFGSPLAHKGRSWLGALFKGNKQPGPDFLSAGDHVLSALELGSSYTWNLAHKDLLADTAVYGPTSRTPYPFIFIGLKDYGWIKRLFTEPGTDGVIRWSGAGFNSRKITLDLTTGRDNRARRVKVERWHNVDVPLVFVPDLNHGSILRNPSDSLLAMTEAALAVSSRPTYDAWTDKYVKAGLRAFKQSKGHRWQQFLVHALDERGDGINDFYIEIGTVANGKFQGFSEFEVDVHPFKDDPSFRCFHVGSRCARETDHGRSPHARRRRIGKRVGWVHRLSGGRHSARAGRGDGIDLRRGRRALGTPGAAEGGVLLSVHHDAAGGADGSRTDARRGRQSGVQVRVMERGTRNAGRGSRVPDPASRMIECRFAAERTTRRRGWWTGG